MTGKSRRLLQLAALQLLPLLALLGCGDDPTEPKPLRNEVSLPTDVIVSAGDRFSVPIEFSNTEPVAIVALPLKYPAEIMTCDSISFVDSRCSSFMFLRSFIKEDTIQIGLIDTLGVGAGRGLMATLHFWAHGNAPDTDIVLDLFVSPVLDFGYSDTSLVFGVITPTFRAGRIRINAIQ